MRATARFLLTTLATVTLAASVFAQPPTPVHVKLSLAENKTIYRVGEPVRLVLEFKADRDGYNVEVSPEGWQPTLDVISLSPMNGVTPWLDEYLGAHRYGRHAFSMRALSQTPIPVEFPLNDTLRFDAPGKYSVQITTRRVSPASPPSEFRPPLVLVTNRVNFEIVRMTESDEIKEVKRLSELLAAARDWQTEARHAQDLSFLTGDVATREKVRRFLNPEGSSGNYGQHINFGLFIARNRALVMQLLETAMRDQTIPVTWSLVSTITKLRMLRDYGMTNATPPVSPSALTPAQDPRRVQIQQSYLAELAGSLGKRVGDSQTTTAMTILMALPKETESSDPILAEVLRVLRQQFDSLHPFSQESLLRQHWEKLRDPAIVPSLEKMLGYRGESNKNVHDAALKSLLDIAPEKARQFIIAEIRDPQSLVNYDILQSLPDKSLPEVDSALMQQLRTYASSKVNYDRVHLDHKIFLTARYGSAHIYPELMQFYDTVGSKLHLEARAGLLAYLAKHNEPQALPLIEEILDKLEPNQDFNFLPKLTSLYYSDAIDALLRKRLESDDPSIAGTAAYLISLHGPAADQQVLEARLERWKREWSHRPEEADAKFQGRVEREIIIALGRAKSWSLPPERFKELQRGCVTKLCRENFRTQ